MNTLDARRQAKLEKMIESLNLASGNKAIALEYLRREPADDALLQQAQPENFQNLTMLQRQECAIALEPIRKSGDLERLARFYRLFWAMGKSTAIFALDGAMYMNRNKDDRSWRVGILGKAAIAAMEAQKLSLNELDQEELDWLHEIAGTEPQVLETAQTLGGTPYDNMPFTLAGILLCHTQPGTPEADDLIRRQSELLLRCNEDTLKVLSPALCDYIRQGNPTAPVPAVSTALGHASNNAYLMGLMSTAMFQAQRVEPRARCAVRVYASLYTVGMLTCIARVVPREYLMDQLENLVEDLPGRESAMLLFLSLDPYWMGEDLRRELADRCRSGLEEAIARSNARQYEGLCKLFPEAFAQADEDWEERIITATEKYLRTGQTELRSYLSGSGSLKDSARELENVTASSYTYPSESVNLMAEYRKNLGWNGFTCRCTVILGLVFHGFSVHRIISGDGRLNRENLQETIQALQSRELPLTELMNILGGVYDLPFSETEKSNIRDLLRDASAKPQYLEELTAAARNGSIFTRRMALSALDDLTRRPECAEAARNGILSCAGDSAKQVKELLVTIFASHPEWIEDYTVILKSKKAAERLLAVDILARMGEGMRPTLAEALTTEKSSKVADAIRSVLGQAAISGAASGGDLVEQVLKGGKTRKLQWLLDGPLPILHKTDEARTEVSDDHRTALLVACSELGRIGRSEIAAELAAGIDQADLSALAHEVYEIWFAAGAQAKTKWVLAFAAVYGGASMTPKLLRAINDWPQHARGAIACDAVTALALSSDPAALLAVDAISRKFKFRQVKAAAAAALENAAQELGITAEELADRIVPDLGFGTDGKRIFDYGNRSFTVRLTPTLELEITNHLGKAVKNLPAPGKADDGAKAAAAYDEFKAMKKQIRTTVTTQKARLEAALSTLRCWSSEAWQALFVRNPIMHQFAISLIWGIYADGKLETTFRYMEDGTFNTVDEDEYELPAEASIGLVHPIELDEQTLSDWKQQLEDYEITQSISQLERPVHRLESDQSGCRSLERFGGKQLNGLSLAGKLLGMGWFRGSVQDGGMYGTFYREDPTLGLGVELNFSGSFVGDENDTVTVYDAVFYKAGTVKRGSYCYDTPKEADIFSLDAIPSRYYSEIIYQLERATASSTETDADWKSSK